MRKTWSIWSLLFSLYLAGCSGGALGTEAEARKFYDAEFKKWIAGQENLVATMESKIANKADPVSYTVRSVVPDEPDFQAQDRAKEKPKDWRACPVYRFNVAIEWNSKAGTPLTKITTYTLTWNPEEKKWYITERFL